MILFKGVVQFAIFDTPSRILMLLVLRLYTDVTISLTYLWMNPKANPLSYFELCCFIFYSFVIIQVDNFPDCLQRILQDICGPLKSKNPGVLSKLRALHGLNIFVDSIAKELAAVINQNDKVNTLQNQLPFVSLYLLHTLLDFVVTIYRKNVKVPTLNWEESAVSIFIALEVLKKVSDMSIGQTTLGSCTKRLVMLLSNSLVPLVAILFSICTS